MAAPADAELRAGDAARTVGGAAERGARRFCDGLPRTTSGPRTSALKLAGAGGDGAQTAALLLARAAINEGFDATHIPSYGPESRGGTSYADVHIAEDEVLSPAAPTPHVLVAFNAPSLAKFGPAVPPGGVVIYDSSVIAEPAGPGRRESGWWACRSPQIAADLGQGHRQEHRGARRAAGGHADLPEGDLPRPRSGRRSPTSAR